MSTPAPSHTKFTDCYSFSYWALANITEWNEKTPDDASKVVKVGKLITTEIVTALLIPVAVIETVAQVIILLLAKMVDFCIPKDKSKWFEDHVFLPILLGTICSISAPAACAVSLKQNLMKNGDPIADQKNIAAKVANIAQTLDPFFEAHIDTLCTSGKK